MARPTRRPFELIPAIDLVDGRVVRLVQGRFEQATTFGADPLAVARRFWADGARTLHVVDLDAARTGRRPPRHADLLARLAAERPPGTLLQVGGGFRDARSVEDALALGIDRVLVGTLAVREPALVDALLRARSSRVGVSADARDGRVRVAGWLEDAALDVVEAVADLARREARTFLVTAIERDGTMTGPDTALTARLRSALDVVAPDALLLAGGGVGRLEDLTAVRDAGADGVVVGRALLAGAFGLREALDVLADSSDATS